MQHKSFITGCLVLTALACGTEVNTDCDSASTDHRGKDCVSQTACFSPTQNLDRAYDDGARGCPCTLDAADQCLPDSSGRLVALVCANGTWQAVEDGPCAPMPSADTECYSPSQHLELAYSPGAVGCPCAGEADECVADDSGRLVALSCEAGRWQSGEDGPCAPEPQGLSGNR